MRLGTRPRTATKDLWRMIYPVGVRRIRWCPWFGVQGWPARLLLEIAAAQLTQLGRTGRVAEEQILLETCGRKCRHRCDATPEEEAGERLILEDVRREILCLRQRARAEHSGGKRRRRRVQEAREEGSAAPGTFGRPARRSGPDPAEERPCSA